MVALDQRGHGLADHAGPFTRAEFVADAAAVIDRLGSDPVVMLGHFLGGITAYQLAAQHPELVRALIIEDVGAIMRQPEVSHPVLDVRGWPRSAPQLVELPHGQPSRDLDTRDVARMIPELGTSR